MDTYSVKEIADMLNTNPETVRRWIRSGKLESIQESRKGGNVVTKKMLDAFLKTSPKYAGIATGLLASPVGLTTVTAAIVGGILAQQLIKNDEIKNIHVNTAEIKKLLLANIQSSRENIARKKKSIKHLQEEIVAEQERIDKAEKLIKELEKNTDSQKD
ncbi:MAG: helix-turn-helix domain-containing protein [Herbinix sp.]|nr:helix-turn-helix domain-containing protein [Herbinix sp.]